MKNNIFRILAYIMDLFFIYLIIYLLSFVSILNPNKDKIELLYDDAKTLNESYINFTNDLDDYYKDKEFSDEEINSLIDKYSVFVKDIDFNNDVNIDNIKEETKKIYVDNINDIQYRLSKLNRVQDITLLIVLVLYFGLLQFILKGQTLFKKIFKIKVVNLDGTNCQWYKIFGRSLIVNEIIFVFIPIILTVLSKDKWITANIILEEAKYIIEISLIFILIIREDGRTLHDLIFKTKVISLKEDSKELEVIEVKEENSKEEKNKQIKEKSSRNKKKKVNKPNAKKVNNKNN